MSASATATKSVFIWKSETAQYTGTEWGHGIVLTFTPIQVGGLCPGLRIAETVNVATVYSMYDALMVARLHAEAKGHGPIFQVDK